MNNQKKNHELIRQNEKIVKKSQKHDANLQKNSTLYFQVGLIVCLLAAYGLLEMKFETTIPPITKEKPSRDIYVDKVPIYKPEVIVANEPDHLKKKPNTLTNKFEEVPDNTPDIFIEKEDANKEESTPELNPGDIIVDAEPVGPENVSFEAIEQVPIYPGCEKKKTNDAKRKCMSDKITRLVQKKFDTGLGEDLGLSGKQVIRTQFKIDKTGHVKDVKVRGTHPDLEEEAKRVINIIPEMTPGKQRDKNVGVIYSLPIVFKVQN